MFHSREINNRINRVHERALRIAYKGLHSTFQELLSKDGSVSIHHRNLQVLATEIYKFIHGLSPKLMGEVFRPKEIKYNLRTDLYLVSNNIRTVHYGLQSISYLGPRIWKLVPDNIKEKLLPRILQNGYKRVGTPWLPVQIM